MFVKNANPPLEDIVSREFSFLKNVLDFMRGGKREAVLYKLIVIIAGGGDAFFLPGVQTDMSRKCGLMLSYLFSRIALFVRLSMHSA